MIILNGNTIAQLIIALVPGLIVGGVASALGGQGEYWALLGGVAFIAALDAFWRLFALSDEADDEGLARLTGAEPPSRPGLLHPDRGGHVFFLPNFVVAFIAFISLLFDS